MCNTGRGRFARFARRLSELPSRGVGYKLYVPCEDGEIIFDVFTCVCFVDAHLSVQARLQRDGTLGRLTPARLRVILESVKEVDAVWNFLDNGPVNHRQII